MTTLAVRDPDGSLVVRAAGLSVRTRTRTVVVGVLLIVLAVGAVVLAVCVGPTWIPPARVTEVVTGGGGRAVRYQVLELRLPRALVGALAGACLALSGALLQDTVRNPLASPDVLGITSGAGVGAVAVYVLGWRVFGAPLSVSLPLAAVIGGTGAALLVFSLSGGASVDGLRLILVGIGVNAALLGTIHGLLVVGGAFDVASAQVWLTGDLSADARRIAPLGVTLAIVGFVALASSRSVATLALGRDLARGVGVRVDGVVVALLACSVVAASVAVGAAGPLGFVALVAPQCARVLLGRGRDAIACAALCGVVLVTAADVVARTVLDGRVSVGLVTSMIGGPVLLALVIRLVRTRR